MQHSIDSAARVERLKALFDLNAAVLDQLCRIGSAYKEMAGVEL
jgi:hypothetical protein